MRNSDVIYQAAIAHQTELRRVAAAERPRTELESERTAEAIGLGDRLASLLGFRRRRAQAAAAPNVAIRHV